jgi:hypothetical protein
MLQHENPQTAQNLPPQVVMLQMVTASWISQSLYAAAKLGIADFLQDGSKSSDELATLTGVKAQPLYRLLRALASVGIFAEQEPGYFSLTPLAECLVSDVPGSMRALAIMCGTEHYQAWGGIIHSLKTGESAFAHLSGMPLFEYLLQKPESARIFNQAMTSVSSIENSATITGYDFSGIHQLVDVGGGHGSLITSILQAYPKMRGILFELPPVIASAKDFITTTEVSEQCELVAGNFLEFVPSGGDAYILKNVLHNWDDERAIKILKNCHSAMKEDGKLLVVERVIPSGNEPFFGKFLDLMMMVMFSGSAERTEQEYRKLFEASGFRLSKIVSTPSEICVIEGVRV